MNADLKQEIADRYSDEIAETCAKAVENDVIEQRWKRYERTAGGVVCSAWLRIDEHLSVLVYDAAEIPVGEVAE